MRGDRGRSGPCCLELGLLRISPPPWWAPVPAWRCRLIGWSRALLLVVHRNVPRLALRRASPAWVRSTLIARGHQVGQRVLMIPAGATTMFRVLGG